MEKVGAADSRLARGVKQAGAGSPSGAPAGEAAGRNKQAAGFAGARPGAASFDAPTPPAYISPYGTENAGPGTGPYTVPGTAPGTGPGTSV
ncbi:hypothetical protein [Paenibacillus macerans]|uniref:hypothetical protein n=1 Tax=Paenibacillus macerans TaxID=44252 RepID=UPI000A78D739|nr:hypothetical protein [Paenibacillus macerans]MCY7561107.1 hypothetical protein [Paenibacillus macerans]